MQKKRENSSSLLSPKRRSLDWTSPLLLPTKLETARECPISLSDTECDILCQNVVRQMIIHTRHCLLNNNSSFPIRRILKILSLSAPRSPPHAKIRETGTMSLSHTKERLSGRTVRFASVFRRSTTPSWQTQHLFFSLQERESEEGGMPKGSVTDTDSSAWTHKRSRE